MGLAVLGILRIIVIWLTKCVVGVMSRDLSALTCMNSMTRSAVRRSAPTMVMPVSTLATRHAEIIARLAADAIAVVLVLGAMAAAGSFWMVFSCAVALACAATLGLYRTRFALSALAELPGLVVSGCCAVAVSILAASMLAAKSGFPTIARDVAETQLLLIGVMFAGRALAYALVRGQRRRGRLLRRALIVGTSPQAGKLAETALENPVFGLWPSGVVGHASKAELSALIHLHQVEVVVLDADTSPAVLTPPDDVRVWAVASHPATAGSEDHVLGIPLTRLDRAVGRPAKRAMDVIAAAIMLVVLSPVMLACALAVRLETGPGVLFRQRRVGAGGREFTVLKFRTLRPVDDDEAATLWNVSGDPRLGRVGKFLRSSSLDELPQLLNILAGQMSLVGPRPERPFFAEQFAEEIPGYAARHRVRPGLTGLAQVHGLRGDTSIEARARLDNFYIENWSPWLDVQILLRTLAAIVKSGG